jgi:hypothetical protein
MRMIHSTQYGTRKRKKTSRYEIKFDVNAWMYDEISIQLKKESVMILSGPYLDSDTKQKTLTISKAIMNQYGKFRGVASIDMLVGDL